MIDERSAGELTNLLSSYVSTMNNMRKRTGGKAPGLSLVLAMNTAIDLHAGQLFDMLPPLNLHEVTALSELVNSRLNTMRMRAMRRPGK